MDPLTHLMAGALIGHAGSAFCPEPAATLTAIAAAILPDFDFYARKYEGSKFLKVHHGATHSISGIVIQSGFTAAGSWIFFHFLPVLKFREPTFSALLMISFVSVLSHIFLDLIMHNNGLPLLWPFTPHRFCVPLILGVNPRTVSHECGEKQYLTCFGCQSRGGFFNPVSWILIIPASLGFFTPEWRIYAGLLPWLAAALYLGLCYILRECARRFAMRFEPDFKTARAYPARSRPDRWLFVLDDGEDINAVLADCMKRCVMRSWHLHRDPLSIGTSKALQGIHKDLSDTIRHLFPVEIPLESGILIEFHDLSYLSAEPTEIGTVRVYLDPENRVIREIYQEIW